MKRIAIDSNVVDAIADTPGFLEAIQAAAEQERLSIITTHLQRDEIPDAERRVRLLAVYDALPSEDMATLGFVLDVSRLDHGRMTDGVDYENFIGMGNPKKYAEDALIAATADAEADVLVTRESQTVRGRLPHRARRTFPTLPIWDFATFSRFVLSPNDD